VNIVQVAMSLENIDAARSKFLLTLFILAPVALAASALGGWFLARRALTPVDAMVDAARRIEAEDLSKRLPSLPSDDELGRLATVLNDMLARLEQSFGAVRRFSADAAHELRTPLTIIKGEIEVALRSTQDPAEIRQALAWREMRFELSNATLEQAVALFNRKSRMQLAIDDHELRDRRISGIYWADNPTQFAELIESTLEIKAVRQASDRIVFRRR
jgi:signal transduction histidine kinase